MGLRTVGVDALMQTVTLYAEPSYISGRAVDVRLNSIH